MSTTLLDAETFNHVLPMLDKLKAEILAYYEDKVQAAYIMDAAKKLVQHAEKVWGDTSPLYVDNSDDAPFTIETGLDALAATWIAIYLYSQKKFNQALQYFNTVQYYYKQHPGRAEVPDTVFLDLSTSVCYAELGDYHKAAEFLAKATPYFNEQQ